MNTMKQKSSAKIAQCVSQDILLNMFRGDFSEKNMVPPGITQANTVHMLLIYIDVFEDEDLNLLEPAEDRHRTNTTEKSEVPKEPR